MALDEATLRVVALLVPSGPLAETVRRARAGEAAYLVVGDMAAVVALLDKAIAGDDPPVDFDVLSAARRAWGDEIQRIAGAGSGATLFRLVVRDFSDTQNPIIGKRDAAAVARSLVHAAVDEGLRQFAVILRADREQVGLSLRATATRARTSRGRLQAWETRRRSPTVWETVRWAGVFGRRIALVPDAGKNAYCETCVTPWDEIELARIITGLHRNRVTISTGVKDLAARLGVEEQTIDLYESGVSDPPLRYALGAASVLGMGIGLSDPSRSINTARLTETQEDGS
jgi:transcriptional regulator with XRE-family HTH domain